jgi:Asp-tRNA(Asn)/Glu-tRNA(Gln) amidotransferase A subunit family amidase
MSSLKLSAVEMVQSLKKGEITSEELVKSYIEQIKKKEKDVEAWEFFDQELVLKQAKKLDEVHQSGKVQGDLHGVPVGIKDIFDTEDMPTTDGTEIHKKNPSWNDCTVVSKLKQAGAIIMGKTVTTELAYYSPGKTKNPHDVTRTPGGSSSGSAAAVASNKEAVRNDIESGTQKGKLKETVVPADQSLLWAQKEYIEQAKKNGPKRLLLAKVTYI